MYLGICFGIQNSDGSNQCSENSPLSNQPIVTSKPIAEVLKKLYKIFWQYFSSSSLCVELRNEDSLQFFLHSHHFPDNI